MNHEPRADGGRQGLHDKGRKKGTRKKRTANPNSGTVERWDGQGRMF